MQLYLRMRRSLRLRSRFYWRSEWATGSYVSDTPAIIVGGSMRSGTTLMRTVLDSHPHIAAGPETWMFVYRRPSPIEMLAAEYGIAVQDVRRVWERCNSLAQFLDEFLGEYARRMGKARWAEKSPGNVTRLDYIWRHFPHAKFIHMIRDGRDVVCSMVSQRERLRHEGRPIRFEGTLDSRIRTWRRYVSAGIAWRGHENYLEIRYEDLVSNPKAVIGRVLDFVGEPWSDDVLCADAVQRQRKQKIEEYGTPEVHHPIFRKSIGRWRKDLSEAEARLCWRRAGDLLENLGYER